MKKCSKCKEIYPVEADTCPQCHMDLDTGEMLEIAKKVDLVALKKAYSLYKQSTACLKICIGLIIGLIIISNTFFHGFLPSPLGGIMIFLVFIVLVLFGFIIPSAMKLAAQALGYEASVLRGLFPYLLGYKYIREAKDVLLHNNQIRDERWSIFK